MDYAFMDIAVNPCSFWLDHVILHNISLGYAPLNGHPCSGTLRELRKRKKKAKNNHS